MNRLLPYQDRTCELFEEQGHPTIRQDSQLQSGYVHSLGHGLGLDVHERPWFSKRAECSRYPFSWISRDY